MEYEELFRSLWDKKVRFLICGGLAVNIYGIPRMTADIDLLLDFEPGNLAQFGEVLQSLSYKSTVPVPLALLSEKAKRDELTKAKNMIAYSFYNSRSGYMNVDVLLDTPFSFEELWDNRDVRDMNDYKVNVLDIDHLIEMKKYSNRPQDQKDIILLSKLPRK